MMSRPNRLAKFGNDRWYVTTFVPRYGASSPSHRFSAASRRLVKSARRCSKYARSFGRSFENVRFLQLQDEARLRLHVMRILVPARERFDRRAIAGHFAGDRGEILGRRDDGQFPLSACGERYESERDGQRDEEFHEAPKRDE